MRSEYAEDYLILNMRVKFFNDLYSQFTKKTRHTHPPHGAAGKSEASRRYKHPRKKFYNYTEVFLNMELYTIWERIKENKRKRLGPCSNCPLGAPGWVGSNWEPLLLEPEHPESIGVMVVTEGPNRKADKKHLISMANHPTFTFLYALFRGKFEPCGEFANAYWTHVRKCFVNGRKGDGFRAISRCKPYLLEEIRALKPKLIVSVGGKALNTLFNRRGGVNLKKAFESQVGGVFDTLDIDGFSCEVSVVPHPSGLSRFWNKPPQKTANILNNIMKKIEATLKENIKKTSDTFVSSGTED